MAKKAAAVEKLGVSWKTVQRKRVYGSVEPLVIDPKPLTKEEAWAALHARYSKVKLYKGNHQTLPQHEKMLSELREELRQKTVPGLKADPLRELMRFHLAATEVELPKERWNARHGAVIEACLALWTEAFGLPFATEMLLREFKIGIGSISCGDEHRVTTHAEKDASTSLGSSNTSHWLLLRRQVLAASKDAYDAAKARCEEILGGPLSKKQPLLLNVFCRDPGELHDLVARLVQPVPAGGNSYPAPNLADYLSGVFDPELARRIAFGLPLNYACAAPAHAFDLVDNLGQAAAPALVEMLRRISSGDRQPLADAAALADLEVARAAVKDSRGAGEDGAGEGGELIV
ncbi:MAG: hypothetical protein QM765_35005 [Myxococcales bacterium]